MESKMSVSMKVRDDAVEQRVCACKITDNAVL
jgi:hypothetical protein